MTNTINTSLNDVFKTTPLGNVDSAAGTTFYGLNHRQTPSPISINTDGYGLAFFTRPQLNMKAENLRAERKFIPLLTNDSESIQRIIRCSLDPRLDFESNGGITSAFVDPLQAFIPLLTNHCLTMSGWPDPVNETYTSKPGAYKEVFGFTDSSFDVRQSYDLTATFRNMEGDPITTMMYHWCMYQSLVYQGIFVPYLDFLVKQEIDYNTRIYRLVLDKSKRFVQKIACTGASMPISPPIGAAFNFDTSKPLNMSNEQIQIQFRSFGARYNDPITVFEFNKVVGIFNPSMREEYYQSNMQEVPMEALSEFNHQGYPRINPDTNELLWYVSKANYARVMSSFSRHYAALTT